MSCLLFAMALDGTAVEEVWEMIIEHIMLELNLTKVLHCIDLLSTCVIVWRQCSASSRVRIDKELLPKHVKQI